MANKHRNSSEIEKLRDEQLNRMLDAALARYTAVEPRAGLEDRVLAHLRAEPSRPSRHAWWQWGLAGAVAAIAIVVGFAWRSGRIPHTIIANHPSAAIQQPSTQQTNATLHVNDEFASAKHDVPRRHIQRRALEAAVLAAHPRLDQFPSPQPLTPEEIALTQYVKNFPEEAQLVAQAQQEFALETEKEMNDAGSETRPSSSIQQER